jgi:hypothetical protein
MDNLVNEIQPEATIPQILEYNYEIPQDRSLQPELTPEFLEFINNTNITNLRNQRNQLLKETDKYLLPDFPITEENLILIKDYRDKLRNFNENSYIIPDFPF